MSDYTVKTQCRLCDSHSLTKVIELVDTPPGNHFVSKDRLGVSQTAYPLAVNFCNDCKHLQLSVVVAPEILYQQQYSYVSATSPVFVNHLKGYAEKMVDRFSLTSDDLVADIGSNDGTTLSFFQKAHCKIIGVDPAIEVVEQANKDGVPTVCDFFNDEVAKRCLKEYGPAKFITSHNACAHIDDLQGVVMGVCRWLADDGVFVMEVGYVLDVYQNTWFDTIYHEHVDFHSLLPLVTFFENMGMQVFDVERISPQGGSLRVYVQKQGGPHQIESSIEQLISLEKDEGMHSAKTFKQFNARINQVKSDLSQMLHKIKQEGKSIAAYGAPTKATTLLSYFGLADCVDFVVDDNKLKQGLYTPKDHIPVYDADAIYREKPDYVIVLAWNFASSIIENHHEYSKHGGKFIVPLPTVAVV